MYEFRRCILLLSGQSHGLRYQVHYQVLSVCMSIIGACGVRWMTRTSREGSKMWCIINQWLLVFCVGAAHRNCVTSQGWQGAESYVWQWRYVMSLCILQTVPVGHGRVTFILVVRGDNSLRLLTRLVVKNRCHKRNEFDSSCQHVKLVRESSIDIS